MLVHQPASCYPVTRMLRPLVLALCKGIRCLCFVRSVQHTYWCSIDKRYVVFSAVENNTTGLFLIPVRLYIRTYTVDPWINSFWVGKKHLYLHFDWTHMRSWWGKKAEKKTSFKRKGGIIHTVVCLLLIFELQAWSSTEDHTVCARWHHCFWAVLESPMESNQLDRHYCSCQALKSA